MTATFEINGKQTNVWVSISGWRRDVTFEGERDADGNSVYHALTLDDTKALCFEYNGETYHLHDMKKGSMEALSKRVKEQYEEHKQPDGRCFYHRIMEKEFIESMLSDGPWNTRFLVEMPVPDTIVPMMSIAIVGDRKVKVPCKLKKSYNSEPHNGYKLEFEVDMDMMSPEVREANPYICTWRTYTSDIWSMIQSNIIEILPSIDDGKTPEQHIDEYFAEFIK